ncbi:MAG TPA: hypothetical protein VF990_00945 [Candidatus Dormibacteraeota bacterium]
MAAPPRRKRTPQQVRNAIARLDLVKIKAKATKEYGWRRARVEDADDWYRNFLWLCYKHGAPLSMIGRDADDLWHLHILDTAKYARDCQKIFGKFLSHRPIYGRPTAEDRRIFRNSGKLYLAEYSRLPVSPDIVSGHH